MQLVYKSEVIKDPIVNLVGHLRDTIMREKVNSAQMNDTCDYMIKMGGVLYSVLENEFYPPESLEGNIYGIPIKFRDVECIEDNSIEDGIYCMYRKDKSIPIELTPVKTLDEWFVNLPLIYKLDLYNSYSEIIMKHLK